MQKLRTRLERFGGFRQRGSRTGEAASKRDEEVETAGDEASDSGRFVRTVPAPWRSRELGGGDEIKFWLMGKKIFGCPYDPEWK